MTTTQIDDALALLLEPGSVAELRILNTKQATVSGYFNDFHKLAEVASQLDGKAPAIYLTLNPVNPSLLARAANRAITYAKNTTGDADIIKRCWLPIDFDPVRPAGISSTDGEHQAALDRARQVRHWLGAHGWPEPIYADSGNGGHLLYHIDLPNDPASTELVKRCLEALSFEFSDNAVQVDVKTFNAARIWKLYNTMSCKGDNLPERPHRRSKILEVADTLDTVSVDLLKQLAARLPQAPKQQSKPNGGFDLATWIRDNNLPVVSSGPWNGGTKYILNPCPWNTEHTNRSAYIVQWPDGKLGAGCHHNGCASNDWHALRDKIEPGWNEGPAITGKHLNGQAKSAKTAMPLITWRPKEESGGLSSDDSLLDQKPYSITRLADVKAEEVRWLWPGRIPLGKITIEDGDPGLGKSLVTLDLAARMSRGDSMPDGTYSDLDQPASVLLLSCEDDPADTIRPRLDAAGADVSKVSILNEVLSWKTNDEGDLIKEAHLPAIPDDLPNIEAAINATQAKLVVIDPLMAFLGGQVDSHNDQSVRRALAPLAAMAERTGAAILVVRHLNKMAGSNALYRGGGSIGIVGAARSGLLVAKDPDDPEGRRRVLASTKSNLAEQPASLVYHLDALHGGAVRVVWDGTTNQTANTLLAQSLDAAESEAVAEAKAFLADVLEKGAQPVKEIHLQAKDAGISIRTLERAKAALGIKAKKEPSTTFGGGAWLWELPDPEAATQSTLDRQESLRPPTKVRHGGLSADLDANDNADGLLTAAAALGWPRIQVTAGVTVTEGEQNWRNFARWASASDIEKATVALEEVKIE